MQSDKELIRQGKYQEALGDNYNHKPVYVMIFKDGFCIDQLKERFTTKPEAIEWLKENKPSLNDGEGYMYGNINAEWL